ncbi:hypothetical protein FOXB_05240 [Fusarium oxysporum f. sp. conglutinans Fo5176]|uniref:Uncharacterized protein n=1 Tax=Fusarium oxysporum (strain Fo5176) TaxID=660025 RepID=F9FFR1_FUSOF|nr:hypothetical protein FOXB_05240 [Fusarium oxysporum f. sp. conglutinans Fo5176]
MPMNNTGQNKVSPSTSSTHTVH